MQFPQKSTRGIQFKSENLITAIITSLLHDANMRLMVKLFFLLTYLICMGITNNKFQI